MYWFYNICLVLYWLLLVPVLIYRLLFEEGFYDRLRQSAGVMPQPVLTSIENCRGIWVHAASVGEIVAASPIVRELKQRLPDETVIVSVVTATGHRMAERIIPEADAHIFFPVDLPIITERIVNIVKPKAILLVETELWPNFLQVAEKNEIPVMMVNGRISDRSMKRYRLILGFTRRMLAQIRWFCMQSHTDARYIEEMGADPARVQVTGNTKYDQTYAEVTPAERDELRREFGVGEAHPVIVAGSFHEGEYEILLASFGDVRRQYPDAKLILAPRQIPEAAKVLQLVQKYGFVGARRTEYHAETDAPVSVLVLDTIGELGRIYSLADIVIVGGSFVKVGGHNILEPAAHGKPILVGPHMFNFKDVFALLHSEGACRMTSAENLTRDLLRLLSEPQRLAQMGAAALRLVEENQGATKRNVDAFCALAERDPLYWKGAERSEHRA